jgi:hypothetical protein
MPVLIHGKAALLPLNRNREGQPMATQAVKKQPRYILLVDWNRKYDWPTQGGLRHLMQYRATNGFAPAFP